MLGTSWGVVTQMGFTQELLVGGFPQMLLSGSLPGVQSWATASADPQRISWASTRPGLPQLSLEWVHWGKVHQPWREAIPFSSHRVFTLHNRCACPAPCPGNPCWSPEVQWVFWQDLPGNLYLLVGKALFRAPSSERRETHLTPISQPPSACCRQRTTWAMLRTQTLDAAGTLDATQTKKQRWFCNTFCGVFSFSLHSSKQKMYPGKYLQKLKEKIDWCCRHCSSELLITNHKVFMNKFIYYLSSSSAAYTLPCTITCWRKQYAAWKWKQFDLIIYTITATLN